MFDRAYVLHLRAELANHTRRLEELRDPTTRYFEGRDNERMRDITEELIAQQESTVAMYTSILSAVEKQIAPAV